MPDLSPISYAPDPLFEARLRRAANEQLQRILNDPLFQNSRRTSSMLAFIVQYTLEGKFDDLNERTVGIEVFERAPDFDPSLDSTVRVGTMQLRKRLAEYYAKAEHLQELRIEIPGRSYIAEFKFPDAAPVEPEAKKKHFAFRWYHWASASALALALCIWVLIRFVLPVSAIEAFWSPLCKNSESIWICIGTSDASVSPNNFGSLVGTSTRLLPPFGTFEEFVRIGMMDQSAADSMAAFLHSRGKEAEIRPFPISRLAKARSKPLILYGLFLNQWASEQGGNLHFRIHRDKDDKLEWIEDPDNPGSRDWSLDMSVPNQKAGTDYALITRVHDQTTGRWWVGIAGLTGLGTVTANQIVIDPRAMANICASLPKGWERKNLQIVLRVKVEHEIAGNTEVVKTAVW